MTYPPSDEAVSTPPTPPTAPGGGAAVLTQVGQWLLDPNANEMRRGVEVIRLEPKATEVLLVLARRAGQVVSRDDLLGSVWPGVVVGDDALTQTILKLRRALDDDARRPRYIETISKRGYRLIAPVSQVVEGDGAGQPSSELTGELTGEDRGEREVEPAPARRRRAWRVAGFGAGMASIVVALVFLLGGGPELRWPIGEGVEARRRAATPPIVAVLPLVNLSGNRERDYFSDGVTEDIIGALGRYSGLRVISHHSVQQFKRNPDRSPVVLDELGARYIVKGSVRESGDQIRVAVELSDAKNDQVLWAQRYDREGKDIFDVQDQIVRQIVGTLAVRVTHLEQGRAASASPANFTAYDLVLRARPLLVSFDRAANRKARELLAQARALSPDYAEVEVVWAAAEYNRANFGWVEDPAQSLRRAEQHARRALTLNDAGANARAHGQLGLIHSMRGEFEQALIEAARAIEINPSDAVAFDARGTTLVWLGRFEEAVDSLETAFRFNPAGRSSGSGFSLSLAHHALGQYAQALAVVDATLARYPQASFLYAMRAAILVKMGAQNEARSAAAQLRRLDPFFSAAEFGNRFVDPTHQARVQESLRVAGL